MEAWLSWALVIAISGAAYWYYSQNNTRRRHRSRPLQRIPETAARAKDEALRQWDDTDGPFKGQAKTSKAKAQKKAKKPAQEVADKSEAYLSTASSTAGVDADDDLSPVTSPTLSATTAATITPSGRDVSDMLEPRAAAPSVLRLTPESQPARQKQPQQQRPATPQETKKQRQNKKKAEEAKLAREQAEKDRQVLLEKQRRTAREARGEPAKNGLQAARAPTSNPWTSSQPNVNGGNASFVPVQNTQLLDTFDPDQVSTASSNDATDGATNGTSTTTNSLSNSAHWQNLPSEEEQMRFALEDSEWTTVPKGRKVKKTKTNEAGDGDASEKQEISAPRQEAPVFKKPVVPAEAVRSNSSFAVLDDTPADGPTDANAAHPLDSDWPVV